MTATITAPTDIPSPSLTTGDGALARKIAKEGRFPPVTLSVKPLGGFAELSAAKQLGFSQDVVLDRFLGYKFSSSMMIPVDTFSFTFVAPDGPPLDTVVKEGDIMVLTANGVTIGTGLVDQTYVETDANYGEKCSVSGRDLLGQFEDQDAVSLDSKIIRAGKVPVLTGVRMLAQDTRIRADKIRTQAAPTDLNFLATEPGESKLAALQRFLEPLNCIAWMDPGGTLVVGKPKMDGPPKGKLYLIKGKRVSNVMSMNVSRTQANIPNIIVPVWTDAQAAIPGSEAKRAVQNGLAGPARLFSLGHRVPKTVVVGAPNATDAQGIAEINRLYSLTNAGDGDRLNAYVKREFARYNFNSILVQAVVPGHYNEAGEPYLVDTMYHVIYDRGNIDMQMYLYQVEYELSDERGQITTLYLCQLGTIVADVRAT